MLWNIRFKGRTVNVGVVNAADSMRAEVLGRAWCQDHSLMFICVDGPFIVADDDTYWTYRRLDAQLEVPSLTEKRERLANPNASDDTSEEADEAGNPSGSPGHKVHPRVSGRVGA